LTVRLLVKAVKYTRPDCYIHATAGFPQRNGAGKARARKNTTAIRGQGEATDRSGKKAFEF
jgi:hypothetical protein